MFSQVKIFYTDSVYSVCDIFYLCPVDPCMGCRKNHFNLCCTTCQSMWGLLGVEPSQDLKTMTRIVYCEDSWLRLLWSSSKTHEAGWGRVGNLLKLEKAPTRRTSNGGRSRSLPLLDTRGWIYLFGLSIKEVKLSIFTYPVNFRRNDD